MKSRLKIILISSLSLILIGCNKISENVKGFENNINNKNYEFAYDIYNKNKKNIKFVEETNNILEQKIDELIENINEKTIKNDKSFVELVTRIKGEDFASDLVNKIEEIEKEKEELSKGISYLENQQYYLAICEFKKINETSKNLHKAQEYINNNIKNARREKLDNAKKMYDNKQFDIALKELEDIKNIINSDVEVENLINDYTLEKDKYENNLQAKKQEQLEEERKQKGENNTTNNVQINSYNNDIEYIKYYNTRYQFSIEYPSDLIQQPAPTNNDGRVFKNINNTVGLVIKGYNNVLYETVEESYNKFISTLDIVTYTNLSERSYVVSWEENSEVFYSCKVFGDGSINEFTFRYPKDKANVYDKVVEKLYDSFTPGNLSLSY